MVLNAACHIHSTWSYDGKWTLHELAREFARKKYRVLMLTEHDRGFTQHRWDEYRKECARLTTDELFLLPGLEYSDRDNRVHILTWGNLPFLGEERDSSSLLRQVNSLGGAAVFAHPSRREAWKAFNPAWRADLVGIELWNRKTDGWAPSKTARALLDRDLVPFAGMDFHSARQMFPLSMGIDHAGPIDEASLVRCLRNHRCHPRFRGHSMATNNKSTLFRLLRVGEAWRRTAAKLYRKLKQ